MNRDDRKALLGLSVKTVIFTVGLVVLFIGAQYYPQDRTVALAMMGVGLFMVVEFLRDATVGDSFDKSFLWLGCVLILVLGVGVRWLVVDLVRYDMENFFIPWYDYIDINGGWRALGDKIGGYSPLFYYYLTFATYLPIRKVVAIKLLPIIFDFIAAVWTLKIIRFKYPNRPRLALLSFALVVLLPTLVTNSSAVGQFDSVYIAFLLGTLYYILRLVDGRQSSAKLVWYKVAGLVLYGLAVSVKVHAVFFVLPIVLLYSSGLVKRRFFLLVPLVYFIMLMPSYLLGKSLSDAASWQIVDVNYVRELAAYAPTIYQLIPYFPIVPYDAVGVFSVVSLVLLFVLFKPKSELITKESIVRIAMVSLLVLPFMLPGMRERYFLPAEVMAIIYAFYFPRRWFVPVVLSSIFLILASYHHWYCCNKPFFEWYQLSIVVGVLVVIVLKDYFVNDALRGN